MFKIKKVNYINLRLVWVVWFLLGLPALALAVPQEDPLIPRAVFFSNPKQIKPKLSPDGKWLAYLAPAHGALNVWVGKLGQHKSMRSVTHHKKRAISSFWWAKDNEHILFVDDYKGNENWRLYQVNIKNNRAKVLFAAKDVQCRVLAMSNFFPEEVLIGVNQRRKDFHDIYKLNIKTGQMSLVYENNDFEGFVFDDKLKAVIGVEPTQEGGMSLSLLGKQFVKKSLFSFGVNDVLTSGPLGVSKKGEELYFLDSREHNTVALNSINLKTKTVQTIAHDLKADIGDIFFHPTEKTPEGYAVTYDIQKWHAVSQEFKKDIDFLDNVAAGEFNIISSSLDNQKWLIQYTSDIRPARYYFYDRASQKAYFLFSAKPDLEKQPLTTMKSVVIKARDGLPLVSYFSAPRWLKANKKQAKNLSIPMVLVVHGGPHARDYWGYHGLHQWLANRGYAVLSVNYRGSSGFGKEFSTAGFGEWGGKMQEDLEDAVNWAVSRKGIDPNKVAIFGGSYGGYAALMGLTKTPELFACGVDIVGPSNLVTFANSVPDYWRPGFATLQKMLGADPSTVEGKKILLQKSPISLVTNIKKPLLIGHGKYDPRVKMAESEQIVSQMLSNKIPVIYVLYPDEGHGFARPENRRSFYAITEEFLAKHLGGRLEPIKEKDFLNSSLQIKEGKDEIRTSKDAK